MCWGTGDRFRTGTDLRRLRDEESKCVAEQASRALASAAGAEYKSCGGDVLKIIEALDKLGSKRDTHWQLQGLCCALANVLRRGLGIAEVKI